MEFSKQQLIGFGGGVLLLLGIFLPVVSMPVVGSVSIFSSGRVDGYVLLGLTTLSLFFVFQNTLRLLKITSVIAFSIVFFNFVYTIFKINKLKSDLGDKLQDNPFSGLAQAMVSTVQIQYGWVFLFIGSLLLLYIAFAKNINKSIVSEIAADADPIQSREQRSGGTRLVSDDVFLFNAGTHIQPIAKQEFKACPYCAEDIKAAAIKCKHCGSMVEV